MNGSAAKAERRDLRRAVGESAIQIIDDQTRAISHLVEVSNRSVGRLDAIERSQLDFSRVFRSCFEYKIVTDTHECVACARFQNKTFRERLKWLVYGR